MKAGVASNLAVVRTLREAGVERVGSARATKQGLIRPGTG